MMLQDVYDLGGLDEYLSSDYPPDRCMQLSDLDGFLTGVLCSPELIMPSEWLPVGFSDERPDVPPDILEIVLARYNEIAAGLNASSRVLEPIFWHVKEGHAIATDWCKGVVDASALRREASDNHMRSKQAKQWMHPIIALLFDENGVSQVGATEEQLDALLDAFTKMIPKTVPKTYGYWQEK